MELKLSIPLPTSFAAQPRTDKVLAAFSILTLREESTKKIICFLFQSTVCVIHLRAPLPFNGHISP